MLPRIRYCALLFLVFAASELYAQPLTIGNRFVTARIFPDNGKVTIVTTPGGYYGPEKGLTFNDESFLTFMVDGRLYTNNENSGISNDPRFGAYLDNGNSNYIADTVETIWKIGSGDIIQDVYPVEYDYSGQMVLRWRFKSRSSTGSDVGVQFLLDTRVVNNDRARVLTRFGYNNAWTLYTAGGNVNYPDIPVFYQAFQNDLTKINNFNPGVVSQGTLIDSELNLIKPDAVLVGDWNYLSYLAWGVPNTIPPANWDRFYGDSAVLMIFPGTNVTSGYTQDIGSTSYGTGEFETCTGDMYALIFRPRKLKSNAAGDGYRPNPFTVDMYLFNTNEFTQAAYVKATLNVGPHLTILDSGAQKNNTQQTQFAKPSTIGVSGVGTTQWHVLAEKTCDPDTTYLTFHASSNLSDTSFTKPCRLPLLLPCLDRDTLPPIADPTVIAGHSKATVVHDDRPKDKGIRTVVVSGFDPKSFSWSIVPSIIPCTHDKISVTVTQTDTSVAACGTITITDCADNVTVVPLCFAKYPPVPDTIRPRITLIDQLGSYDGTLCNMKYDSLLAADDTAFDTGLDSIIVTPGTTPVNMRMLLQPFPNGVARHGFAIQVIDSLADGSISIRAIDVAKNYRDLSLSYCTIPDKNPPVNTVFRITPYSWSVFSEDVRPYDRKIDSMDVFNRINVRLIKNRAVFEPTRALTRGQARFGFNVEVVDTLKYASFCVRTKDLADSSSLAPTAHWWSGDTCVHWDTIKDVWPPNIGLDPPPFYSPDTVHVSINDLHYYNVSQIIGWDRGIDKVWFTNVHGMIVPKDTIYGGCLMTVPSFDVIVANPTAIDSISTVCIHVLDCAGNETDTCWKFPIAPDKRPPTIVGTGATHRQLDFVVADTSLFDRGLSHTWDTNYYNFSHFERFDQGVRMIPVAILRPDLDKSSIGTLASLDLWASKSPRPLEVQAHTNSIDFAVWVQDLSVPKYTFAHQDADLELPVRFVANDSFVIARKGLTEFDMSFDLVGDQTFSYVGVDQTGTAAQNFRITGTQTLNRLNLHGVSQDGTPLLRSDTPLVYIIMHCAKSDSTRQLLLVPVDIAGANISYNGGTNKLITNGRQASAIVPAPYGYTYGGVIVAQGSCSPSVLSGPGGTPSAAFLDYNHPNPFHDRTLIGFTSHGTANVVLSVFDQLGVEVTRLIDGAMEDGYHTVLFEAARLPAGVYYLRMQQDKAVFSRRMELAK